MMARSRHSDGTTEEREASDGSVEEITEEDFKQDGVRGRSGTRGWPTTATSHADLMGGYSRYINRNYASTNLYNFAWAQAVQNKPLGITEQRTKEEDDDEVFEVADSGDEEEKEEGELEEGEIDGDDVAPPADDMDDESAVLDKQEETMAVKDTAALTPVDGQKQLQVGLDVSKKELFLGSVAAEDTPIVAEKEEDLSWDWGEEHEENMEDEHADVDLRVMVILEKLDTVTDEEAEKSFKDTCSRLLRSLESLQKMILEGEAPVLEAIVQAAFGAVKTVEAAYLNKKEQNENLFARFLTYIKRQEPAVFAPEQMVEINEMMPKTYLDAKVNNKDKGPSLGPVLDSIASGGSGIDVPLRSRVPRLEPLVTRNRTDFSLLDPRAKLDEDSLPSPTREDSQPALDQSKFSLKEHPAPSQPTSIKNQIINDSAMPSYVTDALKAVSKYQQKYDRISFMTSNDLPSPTPSEESNDHDAESYMDVSSSVPGYTSKNMKPTVPSYMIGQTPNYMADVQTPTSMYTEASVGFNAVPPKVSQPAFGMKLPAKAIAKSRDPRLRLVNPNAPSTSEINKPSMPLNHGGLVVRSHEDLPQNSRKNKGPDGHLYENYSYKRQRNGVSGDSQVILNRGSLLEGNDSAVTQSISGHGSMGGIGGEYGKQENGSASSCKVKPDVSSKATNLDGNHLQSTSTTTSISSLLSLAEVAVNPSMLLQILKEQQRLAAAAAESQQVTSSYEAVPTSTVTKVGTQASSANSISVNVPGQLQKPDILSPSPTQTATMGPADTGRIRMKPRDPRRILHTSNTIRKSGMLDDRFVVREQAEEAQTSSCSSQSLSSPDISQQLTTTFKSISAIGSQPPNAAVMVSLDDTKPIPMAVDELNARAGTTDLKVLQSSTPTSAGLVASQSADPWGDVDHLLDGYDDQQKAAIQRERARRIEEQNKMFAARKLCLVLDLDHTLLNSAKFIEVEPVHEEILRKKEEQDREKSQRHLYRFQHMGMWTKLRPGIWNFLEKASKLFELHLYTMGNHLYATEMAKVLDPTGSLFAGRVISRGDDNEPFDGDERVPKSKDLEGVLGMESAVVIIDDSVKVWPHNRLNLIVVERYTYFPCSRRQFGLFGPSLLEIDHDERPEDGTLASSLAVIERIHQNFFSHAFLNNVDVRNILASEQRRILSGCRIVFSRIFPVGEVNPHLHPLWQTAEQFGAVCTNQIDDQVTHVVANSLGTDKVNWALSTGRFVVHPGWVEASALLYRRASEQEFAVKI